MDKEQLVAVVVEEFAHVLHPLQKCCFPSFHYVCNLCLSIQTFIFQILYGHIGACAQSPIQALWTEPSRFSAFQLFQHTSPGLRAPVSLGIMLDRSEGVHHLVAGDHTTTLGCMVPIKCTR